MAIITGNVATMGLESLSMLPMRLTFRPSGPATSGSKYLLLSRPVEASVALNGSGAFTVSLMPTEGMHPERWYRPRAEYTGIDGKRTRVDFPDWRLYVPEEGGDFADLIQHPQNPTLAFVSLAEPNVIPTFGSLWLKDNPNDPTDPANTGDLYQWS